MARACRKCGSTATKKLTQFVDGQVRDVGKTCFTCGHTVEWADTSRRARTLQLNAMNAPMWQIVREARVN